MLIQTLNTIPGSILERNKTRRCYIELIQNDLEKLDSFFNCLENSFLKGDLLNIKLICEEKMFFEYIHTTIDPILVSLIEIVNLHNVKDIVNLLKISYLKNGQDGFVMCFLNEMVKIVKNKELYL